MHFLPPVAEDGSVFFARRSRLLAVQAAAQAWRRQQFSREFSKLHLPFPSFPSPVRSRFSHVVFASTKPKTTMDSILAITAVPEKELPDANQTKLEGDAHGKITTFHSL